MRRTAIAALAAFTLAGPVLAAPGGSGGAADMTIVTTADAAGVAQAIAAAGGTVVSTLAGEEGFLVNFSLPTGLNAYVEGYDCTGGPSAEAVCADLELGAVFTADDTAHALRLERELSFVWVADFADTDTNEYMVWRRECLHGGVTRNQLAFMVSVLVDQLPAVSAAVWPEDGLPRETAPVET